MIIRPRQLWWLLPIFLALFLLGALIAKLTDKPAVQNQEQQSGPVAQVDPAEQMRKQRQEIAELIERSQTNTEIPFQVEVKDRQFSGTYQGKSFELSGDVGGQKVMMARTGDSFKLTVNGEQKEPLMLPYALYTPYDHLMLIKGELQSIVPIRLTGEGADLAGYQFSLPPEDVKSMLSLWLGSQFPTQDVMDEALKSVSLTYLMWYDQSSMRLRRMLVTIQIASPQGEKKDQLLFRM
ncbi:hypothetical protein LOK74_09695 [Brevibacillus humidisoli]|uniref:hypothetical protein n=1 Tax=Brevibacillus humidisoli TaxID=2895522 RepID=UPI001E4E3595|nr:hypothetical protein [Brevibacillus humidisoli]UFJ42739.1 hypothetical protein LOK74_09695 [Brevibacillus humidisoli]